MAPSKKSSAALMNFRREYRASLKNFSIALLFVFPIVLLLIRQGMEGLRQFPASSGDIFRFISGYMPLGTAIFTLFIGLVLFLANKNRKIVLDAFKITYHYGFGGYIEIPWKDLTFKRVRSLAPKILDLASVTDGKTHCEFERFFFDDFDSMCKNIEVYKRKVKDMGISI